MIELDPSKRITALEAMKHEFITKRGGEQHKVDSQEQMQLDKEVVENLKKYRG
jgi:hypothetical protein